MKKHILCLGDSNTYGYCAEPEDSEDHSVRFTENERWTCLLQKKLGNSCLVIEEGLSGRTTVFQDPINEGMDAFSHLFPILKSHEPIDLLIVMLGTNDTKERFRANPKIISMGLDRLIKKAKSVDCWSGGKPNILIVCPPPIRDEFNDNLLETDIMGADCVWKSRELAKYYRAVAAQNNCHFFDAKDCEFNKTDCMHLTKKGHSQLAESLAEVIASCI